MFSMLKKLLKQNLTKQKKLWRELKKEAYQKGAYFSATKQTKNLKVFNLIDLDLGAKKASIADNVFYLNQLDLNSQKLPPFVYSAIALDLARSQKYAGPIYLELRLKIDLAKSNFSLRKALNLTKKQIKNGRKAGFFNFLIDLNSLEDKLKKDLKDNLTKFIYFLNHRSSKKTDWVKEAKGKKLKASQLQIEFV
jgi:hypothetical protein